MLVRVENEKGVLVAGTIGGGALEYSVLGQAAQAIAAGESKLFQHRLTVDHKMCCGGTVHVFIEVIAPPPQCFIFGAGHVGKALAQLLATLEFDVSLIEGRPNLLEESATRFIAAPPEIALQSLKWDGNTYAVIATHSHALDRELLHQALAKPFQYLGMIGSKRKVLVTRKLFLERGWADDDDLDDIDMPIGVAIAAESPAEIAVSIAARMIEVKNRRGREQPRREKSLSNIHTLIPDLTHGFSSATTTL